MRQHVVALSHGYPPAWSMGGEVSLHRSLAALAEVGIDVTVLTRTAAPYELDGVRVRLIDCDNPLDPESDPNRIARQLESLGATVVIAQNELSLPGVRAAAQLGITSVVGVHTPPRYGGLIRKAVALADLAVYNTKAAAAAWGEAGAPVLHPPISPLPHPDWVEAHAIDMRRGSAGAYTVLSSLMNKGVTVVLELAEQMPDQEFIIVRSPAEPTHGLPDLLELAQRLPNVVLAPRVPPEEVAATYLRRTRVLLVPSRYETYGMSALEAAGWGIPSVHVDTVHVREGIGVAAELVPPLNTEAVRAALERIEEDHPAASRRVRQRAEYVAERQTKEMEKWQSLMRALEKPTSLQSSTRRRKLEAIQSRPGWNRR